MDKSALGWEHVEKVEKHESQKGDYQTGYDSCWIHVFFIGNLLIKSNSIMFFISFFGIFRL